MTTTQFPLGSYFERLQLHTSPARTEEGLHDLTRAQAFQVPFENIDPLLGLPPSLQIQDICQKIITNKRGGYCFELNSLLNAALNQLGFETQFLLARVNYRRPEPGPKTHVCLIAKVGSKEFLVDVGFGGPGLTEPLPLEPNTVSKQNGSEFRLVFDQEKNLFQLQRLVREEWTNLYCFDRSPVLPIDLEMSNHFTSTWGRSPFRNTLICASPSEHGVLNLNAKEIILLSKDLAPTNQETLHTADQLKNVLAKKFKLDVGQETAEKIFTKLG